MLSLVIPNCIQLNAGLLAPFITKYLLTSKKTNNVVAIKAWNKSNNSVITGLNAVDLFLINNNKTEKNVVNNIYPGIANETKYGRMSKTPFMRHSPAHNIKLISTKKSILSAIV